VHAPAAHTSLVQVLPSSVHGAVLFAWAQVPALQLSVVQVLPSSVHAVPLLTAVFLQLPLAQVSAVHGLLSLQLASLVQPAPWRGLSLGPAPEGVKLAFVVSSSLSKRKPSSRIQMLRV
jgi:hypothetical protein